MKLGLRLAQDWASTYNTTWSKRPNGRGGRIRRCGDVRTAALPQSPLEPSAAARAVAGSSRQVGDSLAVLTAAAVATEKVRLGTAILIAAEHTPSSWPRRSPRSIRSAAAA